MINKKNRVGSNEHPGYWIDAHCHLNSQPLDNEYLEEMAQAKEHNIGLFISTALNRQEIDWHLRRRESAIQFVAGIHPYYDKSSIKDFEYLESQCRNGILWGIGEVGYDKRKNNHNFQKTILYKQLDLAREYDLPVVFHVVGRFNELYQTLKNDFPGIRGFIHGFNGSFELVEMFSRLEIAFSIGYKMLQRKDYPEIIRKIYHEGKLLFETDAPFQKIQSIHSDPQNNLLSRLAELIDTIAETCNLNREDILDTQWQAYKMIKR